MDSQLITRLERLKPIEQQKGVMKAGGELNGEFQNVFERTIQDVKNTQKNLEEQQYLLATGQTDDIHSVTIAAAEAQLSVDLLVQLRNKTVESINELMRMNV